MTKLVYLIVYLGIFCLNVAFAIRRGEISLNLFRYVLRVVGIGWHAVSDGQFQARRYAVYI